MQRLVECFRELYLSSGPGAEAGVLLFAAAAGKRVEEMAQVLAPVFPDIVVTTPGSFRESEPRRVFEVFAARNPATVLEADPAKALERALALAASAAPARPLLVTGSFYLVGEIRRLLLGREAAARGGSDNREPAVDRPSPGGL